MFLSNRHSVDGQLLTTVCGFHLVSTNKTIILWQFLVCDEFVHH